MSKRRVGIAIISLLVASFLAAAAPAFADDGDVGLNVEDFNILNGEAGIELWRLKAKFGKVVRNGDTIDLEKPDVRYTMGDPADADYVFVTAAKGRVREKQRYIDLWDNVVVTHDTDRVTGPLARYDSKTRIMTFPSGGTISTPKGSITADRLQWHMQENRLVCSGHVETEMAGRSVEPAKGNAE